MSFASRRVQRVKILLIGVAAVFAAIIFLQDDRQRVEAFSNGPPPSYTDAPDESNCTDCHFDSGPINSGKGSVSITGIPRNYFPGQQIQVTVTVEEPAIQTFGFQITAIDPAGSKAGNFTVPVVPLPPTQIREPGIMNRQYVEHTVAGLFTMGLDNMNTWTFTWTAPAQRIGKVRFYAAGNASNSQGDPNGDNIYSTNTATLSGSAISNFDGDFASDIAYFRPSTGVWLGKNILDGSTQTFTLGALGDIIVPGDYDADGKTDFGVFRPSTGMWMIQQSTLGYVEFSWGTAGDVPAQGDYDGDGKTDAAYFRPSAGTWSLRRSTAGNTTVTYGQVGDKIAQGDYDADGKTDVGIYRPSSGMWQVQLSTGGGFFVPNFGTSTDRPVQADYDGDGKCDAALYIGSSGTWKIRQSSSGTVINPQLGSGRDRPLPGDYDSDGKADLAVYKVSRSKRGDGTWSIIRSADSTLYTIAFGKNSDVFVPSGYLAK